MGAAESLSDRNTGTSEAKLYRIFKKALSCKLPAPDKKIDLCSCIQETCELIIPDNIAQTAIVLDDGYFDLKGLSTYSSLGISTLL